MTNAQAAAVLALLGDETDVPEAAELLAVVRKIKRDRKEKTRDRQAN